METVSYDRWPATSDRGEGAAPDSTSAEPPSRHDRITFAEAARLYAAAGGEVRYLAPLAKLLGDRFVDGIAQADIDYAAAKICSALSPATRNRRVYTPASAVLKFSAARGWRPTLLRVSRPRVFKQIVDLPSQRELDAFGRAAGPSLKHVMRFKLETDATEHEILSLDWSYVNISRKRAILRRADGSVRVVSFSPTLAEMLARRSKNQRGRVFRNDNGKPYSTQGNHGGRLKAAFDGASKRSGVKISFLTLHRIWRARQSDASLDIGSTLDG